jgi:beta-lactamase superfamily II metal-dependent hydrolase
MFRALRALLAFGAVSVAMGCAMSTEAARDDDEESASTQPAALSSGAFGFTTLDVGQGDAAVVLAPGGCVAILDGGPTGAGKIIKRYLRSLNVTRIDFAVVSHFHEDHMGGIDEMERGTDAIPIGKVYDHGGSYDSDAFTSYESQFRGRRNTAAVGQAVSLCNQVDFKFLASDANGASTSDENARSVVVKISYGSLDVLVGGDLTARGPDVESAILPSVGPVEVYKVHHHGSAGSSGARFLASISPLVSFISVAANNSYGHPSPSTVARLRSVGSEVYQTSTNSTASHPGHLELSSPDGNTFTVTQGSASNLFHAKN